MPTAAARHDQLTTTTPDAPLTAIDEAVREHVRASHAETTQAIYRSYWGAFVDWCAATGAAELPAAPVTVARYLSARAKAGAAVATVRVIAAAIRRAHLDAGLSSPTAQPGVKRMLAGIARTYARPARQAPALLPRHVAAIEATARRPRPAGKGVETASPAARRGAVDIALAYVLATGGLRRSEAAALTWDCIEHQPDGSGRVTIRRSKTDQEHAGAVVALPPAAMAALAALRPTNGSGAGRVFTTRQGASMTGATVSRRIREAAKAAGLGDTFSGHSGRVGMARRMVQRGAPLPVVQRQGRWQSGAMVTAYTRHEAAGAALPYLD